MEIWPCVLLESEWGTRTLSWGWEHWSINRSNKTLLFVSTSKKRKPRERERYIQTWHQTATSRPCSPGFSFSFFFSLLLLVSRSKRGHCWDAFLCRVMISVFQTSKPWTSIHPSIHPPNVSLAHDNRLRPWMDVLQKGHWHVMIRFGQWKCNMSLSKVMKSKREERERAFSAFASAFAQIKQLAALYSFFFFFLLFSHWSSSSSFIHLFIPVISPVNLHSFSISSSSFRL